jgi:molybdopterin-guanine dinucleotide biosynthesis protein A
MGFPKPMLPFGPECVLQRVVRLLGAVTPEIVVAAGPQQELPDLPPGARVVRDRYEGRGPLEGLYGGLSGLPAHVAAAYVTGCDVPLLVPAFAVRMTELLAEYDIAVPVKDGFHYPLAAVYRRRVLGLIAGLLAADRLRPAFLFDLVPTRRVPVDALCDVDPELLTLRNLNDPSEYLAALARAGFTAPPEVLARCAPVVENSK